MYKVKRELFSRGITDSGRVQSRQGNILTKLCIISSLERITQNVTVGCLELLSTHPIHIVVWGNFPFKETLKISV